MKIEVTLTFPPEAVYRNCFAPCFYGGGHVDGYTPKVQFCGEWFESGQSRVIEVQDRYVVLTPDYQPKEIPEEACVIEKFVHSPHTGHLFSGYPCSCDRIALHQFFTPHALIDGVPTALRRASMIGHRHEGSVITKEGVTIKWKEVEE